MGVTYFFGQLFEYLKAETSVPAFFMLLIRLVLVFPILRPLHLSRPIHLFPKFWVNGCSSKLSNHLRSEQRQERFGKPQTLVRVRHWLLKKPLRSCLEGQMDHEFLIGQGHGSASRSDFSPRLELQSYKLARRSRWHPQQEPHHALPAQQAGVGVSKSWFIIGMSL